MDEKILRYAKRCVTHVHRNGSYPGGVNFASWEGVLKDCRKYIELAEREYRPEDWSQINNDHYKMECIEYRLRKYAGAARNWGKLK